jgi:protein tyrosine/serine phosphatase
MKPLRHITFVCWLLASASAGAQMPIACVAPGIYRGPAPAAAEDYRQLKSLGINTLLDVRKFRRRQFEEERRCAHAHGMHYKNIPLAYHPQLDGSAERVFGALTDPRLHPIYIHCELGRDRTGLIIGLYRVRCEGWSMTSAYAEMKRFGFRSFFRGLERYFWHCARK